ncbi:lipid kinase YegS [Vibrio astriarenae]|uniref:lipid kinase YegS n=1 Tax=Vibrio astriarenae TaxID=1481923 RepID=UPI0037370874
MNKLRAILNGKKAGQPELRNAIFSAREQGVDVEVRVTWESADMLRLISEAIADGIQRIAVAGGDGSVNEAVTALCQFPKSERPELAILPMGTANDFATACEIPSDIEKALVLALTGQAYWVDSIKANDRCVMNVASAGFGAQVTVETPVELKNFLGGGAYTLTGLVKALQFQPYNGTLVSERGSWSGDVLVGAFCNGRFAGGGQPLAPNAYINDGLMDISLVKHFPPLALPQVVEELKRFDSEGEYVIHGQTKWIEVDFPQILPINLDGEPYQSQKVRFEIQPESIHLVLPENCPCLMPEAG